MAKKNVLVDLDLNKNEVQNAVVQNLATTPASPRAGQIWYNTTDNLIYFYDGTAAKAVGYLPPATTSTLGGVIVGTNISVDGTGKISVASATNTVAGILRIATDAEATTGTAEGVVVNPKQLATAIANAMAGGLLYKGTWNITSATDLSGITLPVKKGYMYMVTGTGPKTIDGIEWNSGDYLVVNADVAAGGSLSGHVEKIDNTESSDIVRTGATQTLTNKTISATDNTIGGLGTTNFDASALSTSIDSTGVDTKLPTEKAVRSAINTATTNMVTTTGTQTLTNKTIDGDNNTIQDLSTSVFKSGVLQTTVRASSSASDTCLATEKAVATAVEGCVHKFTVSNSSLTASSGVCTWEITNTIGSADVICSVREVSGGNEVFCDITYTASKITVKINSSSNIAASTYKAVVVG